MSCVTHLDSIFLSRPYGYPRHAYGGYCSCRRHHREVLLDCSNDLQVLFVSLRVSPRQSYWDFRLLLVLIASSPAPTYLSLPQSTSPHVLALLISLVAKRICLQRGDHCSREGRHVERCALSSGRDGEWRRGGEHHHTECCNGRVSVTGSRLGTLGPPASCRRILALWGHCPRKWH